mmetsp:Transcript_69751/g.186039  ORF Transcript_69751/g.186039 Transcript_69751/m.186039 type:complete len:149 (-) Transcript_69751:31-477(-)
MMGGAIGIASKGLTFDEETVKNTKANRHSVCRRSSATNEIEEYELISFILTSDQSDGPVARRRCAPVCRRNSNACQQNAVASKEDNENTERASAAVSNQSRRPSDDEKEEKFPEEFESLNQPLRGSSPASEAGRRPLRPLPPNPLKPA